MKAGRKKAQGRETPKKYTEDVGNMIGLSVQRMVSTVLVHAAGKFM